MALKSVNTFVTYQREKDGELKKHYNINIENFNAYGNENNVEFPMLDLEDLKFIERELKKSIELEKANENDNRIAYGK